MSWTCSRIVKVKPIHIKASCPSNETNMQNCFIKKISGLVTRKHRLFKLFIISWQPITGTPNGFN